MAAVAQVRMRASPAESIWFGIESGLYVPVMNSSGIERWFAHPAASGS
jgi:hypothetical protein